MFQLPERMTTKRRREDDDDDEDPTLDDVRHDKKYRIDETADARQQASVPVLPFLNLHQQRTRSPSCLPDLTPGLSDDSGCDSPDSPSCMSASGDMDMQDCFDDDFNMMRSNPNSPAVPFMLPERLNPRLPTDSTGRIPTPIYGTFPPKLVHRNSSEISTMDLEDTPRSVERGRRLPSPISETESVATPTSEAGSRLSRLHVTADENMDMDPPTSEPSRSESKTGRARSGAITGKKKFYMGYREDCPKCQAKVPGHNAHFLPL